MAIAELLFRQRVRIGVGASEEFLPYGAIELDASIQEDHLTENEVTQFPVETGVDITDHVRKQPDRVTIRGIVTDTPSSVGGNFGIGGRALDAYGKVLFMLENADLVTLVTTLNTYEDMMIESVSVPRNAGAGNIVELNLTLRQIQTAAVAVAAGTVDKGTQPTTTVQ